MSEFGARLKQAREEQGISLRQIATATKISMGALDALERSDYSRLPGGIFSRAFVRAYALEVGLDPEQTVQDFLVEYEQYGAAGADHAPPEVTPDDLAFLERQRRAMRILRYASIGLVVVIAGGVVAWKMATRPSPSVAVVQPGDPPPVSLPDPPPPPASSVPPAIPPAVVPASSTPDASGPAASAPAGVSTAAPAKGENDIVRLHLQMTGESWVRVTVDGTLQIERTLQAGDTRDTTVGREIYLQVGNAGNVQWAINGRPAKPLGKAGETGAARVSGATIERYVQ